MALIKSIRGTIGGTPYENLTPIDIGESLCLWHLVKTKVMIVWQT
jgi:hypothetical protein